MVPVGGLAAAAGELAVGQPLLVADAARPASVGNPVLGWGNRVVGDGHSPFLQLWWQPQGSADFDLIFREDDYGEGF